MIYRLAAVMVLFATLPVFATEDDSAKDSAFQSKKNDQIYYQNQDFQLNFHGDAHFSARYVKNKDYYAIAKDSDAIDVLTKDNNSLLESKDDPSVAIGLGKLSDGGVLGNYHDNFVMGNGVKFAVEAQNKLNEKVTYGTSAQIKLETDAARRLMTNHAYLFLDTQHGRFEVGNYKSPADSMKLDASSIATIDGGITNDWIFSANIEGRHMNASFAGSSSADNSRNRNVQRPFYTLPYLYTGYYREYIGGGYHVKSTYYSPQYSGFNFGVSYTKDELDVLPFNDNGLADKASYKDVISGGVTYQNYYQNLKYKFSVTGEKSLSDEVQKKYFDLNGFNVGAVAEYAGFKVAGSFANVFKSGLPKKPMLDKDLLQSLDVSTGKGTEANPGDTLYYTLGGAYEVGPAMASITYMKSQTEPIDSKSGDDNKNTLDVVSLGTHYHLSGKQYKFTPYVALNYFTTKEGSVYNTVQRDDNNGGYVLLTGVKVVY